MSTEPARPGQKYYNIQISENARMLLDNSIGQAAESKMTPRADCVGQYANSSLSPVANYVPRPRLHQKIKEQLRDPTDDGAREGRILTIWGLAGAGKSQLVLNYIREYRQDYSAVLWIEAGSKESIERDYLQIYWLLYDGTVAAGQEMLKVEDVVPAVKNWFYGRVGQWLVVLDSTDTIDNDQARSYINLKYFIPDAPGVHAIVTSRSSKAKEISALEGVEVADMEPSEATELFRKCAKMREVEQDAKAEVNRIVKELRYLALAITLAGAYVSMTPRLSSDIRRYLPEYRQRRKELLCHRAKKHVHQYGDNVLSTWEASFEAIADQYPAAGRLLSTLAFVNSNDIYMGLFDLSAIGAMQQSEATSSSTQKWTSFIFPNTEWSLYELESAFGILETYSLVHWRSDQESYSMHKLVHAWGQDRLEVDLQRHMSCLALELLANVISNHQSNVSQKLRIVPHLMANFGTYSKTLDVVHAIGVDSLAMVERTGHFLCVMRRCSEAYEIRRFHYEKIKTIVGAEHPSTLMSMSNLALVLRNQGKYEEAEQIHRQVLALIEALLGKEHPDTLTSMNNLALVLDSQGNYEEAEQMHRQALALKETVLGKQHPDTLTSMNNLALVLDSQGKYEEAEQMHRQELALCRAVLGKEHPDTLTSMNNLALVLDSQGKYGEAEQMHRQELALCEAVLGKKNPSTLTSMNNLAEALLSQCKYGEAERMHRQALALREAVLGKEHPDTLTSMSNLALVLDS